MTDNLNTYNTHDEKEMKTLERKLRSVRRILVRNSTRIQNYNFNPAHTEGVTNQEVTLSNNDTTMEAIDGLLAALSLI